MSKQFLDLNGLTTYDGNIKSILDTKATIVEMTQAQYNALTPTEKNDNTIRLITDVNPSGSISDITATTTFEVNLSNWIEDTTSQSGSTLYKKQINITRLFKDSPNVSIGTGSGNVLPTLEQQTAYNLIQYVTVDDTIPCLYIYTKSIPVTTFYIKVEGVE